MTSIRVFMLITDP